MKQMLLAGAACAFMLSACSQESSPEPVDKAQDAIAAPVGQVSAATVGANTVAGYVPAAAMECSNKAAVVQAPPKKPKQAAIRYSVTDSK